MSSALISLLCAMLWILAFEDYVTLPCKILQISLLSRSLSLLFFQDFPLPSYDQISCFILSYPVSVSSYLSFSSLPFIFCRTIFLCCPEFGTFFHTSPIFNLIEVFFLLKSFVTETGNDRFRQTWDERSVHTVVPLEQQKAQTGGATLRLI